MRRHQLSQPQGDVSKYQKEKSESGSWGACDEVRSEPQNSSWGNQIKPWTQNQVSDISHEQILRIMGS